MYHIEFHWSEKLNLILEKWLARQISSDKAIAKTIISKYRRLISLYSTDSSRTSLIIKIRYRDNEVKRKKKIIRDLPLSANLENNKTWLFLAKVQTRTIINPNELWLPLFLADFRSFFRFLKAIWIPRSHEKKNNRLFRKRWRMLFHAILEIKIRR